MRLHRLTRLLHSLTTARARPRPPAPQSRLARVLHTAGRTAEAVAELLVPGTAAARQQGGLRRQGGRALLPLSSAVITSSLIIGRRSVILVSTLYFLLQERSWPSDIFE